MNESKLYSLIILGTTYTVKSDESEATLLKAVAMINQCLQEPQQKHFRSQDQQLSVVSAAIQLATMLLQKEDCLASMQDKISNLLVIASDACLQNDRCA